MRRQLPQVFDVVAARGSGAVHVQRSMVLRVRCMHVVSPPFRLPQRLYDRFRSLFLLMLPDFSLLLLLPAPVVEGTPPPPTQALIAKVAMMVTVLLRAATVLLQARAAVAAI